MNIKRISFATTDEYARHFTNPSYWQSYLSTICARHQLGACTTIHAGLPGTNPVFIVNNTYVIKLYPDLFGGQHSFLAEREVYRLITTQPNLPAPSLLASGELFSTHTTWSWPYLVTQRIPGLSMTESQLTPTDHFTIATWLGPVVRHLHTLPLPHSNLLTPAWEPFLHFLSQRRAEVVTNHTQWGTLPPHLIAQIDSYLPDLTDLVDITQPPALLHCDLNSDHVLGESINDHSQPSSNHSQPSSGYWQPSGIIDFGDAKIGDPIYELVALHLGLFATNPQLLHTFLTTYGLNTTLQRDFARRAMSMTLLFEFNVCSHIFTNIPEAAQANTLAELANLLWGRALSPT